MFNVSAFAQSTDSSKVIINYGSKGFEFRTTDNNYLLQIQSRFQFRAYTPFNKESMNYQSFDTEVKRGFVLNRARLKVGGNAYRPWLKFFWEYELASNKLLDFRFMVEKFSWLKLKVGQWKVHYNRERVISSGRQQTVDRSILIYPFTIDRQQGVSLYGNIGQGIGSFNYWISVLTGTGRGAKGNDDGHLMYMSRLQWNMFGKEVKFIGSDLNHSKTPKGLLAIAAVTNRSAYTRFSADGGGHLPGFENSSSGQYRVNQFLIESAFMYKGFSWQQEFHWKEIDDTKLDELTHLYGNLVQAGFFLHSIIEWFPPQLEIAGRYAFYYPDRNIKDKKNTEYSATINWFFNGHNNKLSADISYLKVEESINKSISDWRYRLQWDISI